MITGGGYDSREIYLVVPILVLIVLSCTYYDTKAGWRGTRIGTKALALNFHAINSTPSVFLACAMFARSQFLVRALFDFLLLIFSLKFFLLRNFLRFAADR